MLGPAWEEDSTGSAIGGGGGEVEADDLPKNIIGLNEVPYARGDGVMIGTPLPSRCFCGERSCSFDVQIVGKLCYEDINRRVRSL